MIIIARIKKLLPSSKAFLNIENLEKILLKWNCQFLEFYSLWDPKWLMISLVF